jgi:hypothetical protein
MDAEDDVFWVQRLWEGLGCELEGEGVWCCGAAEGAVGLWVGHVLNRNINEMNICGCLFGCPLNGCEVVVFMSLLEQAVDLA